MSFRNTAIRATIACLLLFSTLAIGTAWHEVVGHGLVGVFCRGSIARVEVLGFELYPSPNWGGWDGQYGTCTVLGVESQTGNLLVSLGGSMSTWLVSVVAVALLWMRPWRKRARTFLALLGIWWIDLFTYTMLVWGLRRSIIWGKRYSEPYDAAVGLGVPGWLFQGFVIVSSAVLATALVTALWNARRKEVGRK